ncbi:type II secretion system protein [Denitratisoma sp. DHT3]|uniref:type II secretion system protein n=1 Tax=Denitratisoma sp. DHT3 TaxID=1981880 RepID=UPI0011A13A0F|nr:type II secretion system protein [Denitratisoma sp. DHT3]
MTRRRANGFTLVELSIVFLIVALLLGSGLAVFSTQVDQQKIESTRRTLDDAAAALVGYAASVTPPHLPCPDKTTAAGVGVANDGREDRNPVGTCVVQEGNLPWITLGLAGTDAWSRRIRYRVTPAFSDSATGMLLTSVGTLDVENRDTTPASTAAANVPVVLVSHGKNGSGAISSGGAAIAAPTGADELENTDGDNLFVTRGLVDNSAAPGGEFDDAVTWLSARVLLNRMLEAGKF